MCVCVHLCISKMSDSNDTRDGRRNQYCYYKIFTQFVTQYSYFKGDLEDGSKEILLSESVLCFPL